MKTNDYKIDYTAIGLPNPEPKVETPALGADELRALDEEGFTSIFVQL